MKTWFAGTECSHSSYAAFKAAINSASYHFADDSSKELAAAYQHLDVAIAIAVENKYPFWAIKRMFSDIKPLVSIDDFIGRMLTAFYKQV